MNDFFGWLFSSDRFIPHGHCYLWEPGTLWLNVGSDALIAASYYAIPVALYAFFRRRGSQIAYAWIPLMFATFIFLCGTTHIVEIWTVWHPAYNIAGAIKLATGVVSFATLLALIWIMPKAMLLRTPRQLSAEVNARTAEIAAVNARLSAEVSARDAAERQLREADRRKDEFLATLAHELRNPLAPIWNAAKLLDTPSSDERQRQHSREVISRQVNRMALLLDDLLDVSRITRGRLELKKEFVDLGAVIGAAVETARPLLDAKNHALVLDLPAAPMRLDVDPLRLSQCLSNLLLNAVKFTNPGGQITLAAAMDADGLVICVKDTGMGFEAAAVPEMFKMFAQPAGMGQEEGGLGIGLALVKGLIELHGGTVQAASAGTGQGSQFTIRLPPAVIVPPSQAIAPKSSGAAVPPPAQHSVLVADDNRDAADTLALILEMGGYEVGVANTGQGALDAALLHHPDAMILDIGMPDITGYEVAQRVRQEPWGSNLVLIAMTGWGQAGDKARAKAAGFDHHLTKPVDPDELERLLRAALNARESRGTGAR